MFKVHKYNYKSLWKDNPGFRGTYSVFKILTSSIDKLQIESLKYLGVSNPMQGILSSKFLHHTWESQVAEDS